MDERRLEQEGFFAATPVRDQWQEHLSGRGYGQYKLWDILMFQAWHDRWMKEPDTTTAASTVA